MKFVPAMILAILVSTPVIAMDECRVDPWMNRYGATKFDVYQGEKLVERVDGSSNLDAVISFRDRMVRSEVCSLGSLKEECRIHSWRTPEGTTIFDVYYGTKQLVKRFDGALNLDAAISFRDKLVNNKVCARTGSLSEIGSSTEGRPSGAGGVE
ncbi:hypothetical protein K2X30_00715 [bacterium]|nr:hypothetical protein [bacterium]